MSFDAPTDRRGFLGVAAASALAAGVAQVLPRTLLAESELPPRAGGRGIPEPSDAWLKELKGDHRQVFDMPKPGAGIPLIHVRNYLDTVATVYKSQPATAVVTLYGSTVPLAFNDAMWAKYGFGAATSVTDADTGAPAVRNVFAQAGKDGKSLPVTGAPIALPADCSIPELQKRGAVFILCDNALRLWAGLVAAKAGGTAETVRTELLENSLPGVHLVPAMVVAVEQAQRNRCTYMFQG